MIKKTMVLAIIFMFLLSGVALANGRSKSNWYIGFGVGTGELRIESHTAEDAFSNSYNVDVGEELTFNFGVGGIIDPKVHLGLDVSGIGQTIESDYNSEELDVYIYNYLAAVTFYPMEKGLFLKAGLGLVALYYNYDSLFYDESDTYTGIGALVGIGYDFWLGESFNLGVHADYSRQSYSDAEAPDDTDFVNLYLAFYWF